MQQPSSNMRESLLLKRPMASAGPSINSVFGVTLDCTDALCLSISQSGQSPDIVSLSSSFASAGAYTVAITNSPKSRLARASHVTLPIHAGEEQSVAATKTFVTSMVAGLWLLAELARDDALLAAIRALPEHLKDATRCEWHEVIEVGNAHSLFTLGRGPSLAISNEAALKFKETCQLHAESYSSAEVLHGPVAVVGQGFPVIAFSAHDATEKSLAEIADTLTERGARVFTTSRFAQHAVHLPIVATDHWLTDPISIITTFYNMVETMANNRGLNPDAPRHLRKITETT